jgi:putative FmdB family regulatory protein
MPIYEYQCAACGQIVEKWQKFSEAPLTTCPVCGGDMSKLISSCAFQLKGSGWYVTDYAGKNPSAQAGENHNESNSGADNKEKPEAAKEAKSETPAPPKQFK